MKTDAIIEPGARMPDPVRRPSAVQDVAARRSDAASREPPAGKAASLQAAPRETPTDVEALATRAARELFAGREVDVQSFRDEATGRMVYRVTDRHSGQVLTQTPPEELLRLYAALRQPADAPLVRVEA